MRAVRTTGRSMWRTSVGALAACAALAVAATPAAHAGSLSFTDDGTHRVLHFTADPGEHNDMGVSAPTGETHLTVTDVNPIAVGAGCTLVTGSTDYALCDKAGLTGIEIDLGDRDDRLSYPSADGLPFVVDGGDGDDQLDDAGGGSTIDGGPGDDMISADNPGATGADDLHGGTGNDTIYYLNRFAGVSISLDDVANDGVPGEHDDVHSDFEHVYGGHGADTITGTAGDDDLTGSDGADTISGLGGDDTLDGSFGCDRDVLLGGTGDDTLIVNGRVHADGGADDDTFTLGGERCGGTDVHGGSGHDLANLRSVGDGESFSLDDAADDGMNGTENWHSDIEDMTVGGTYNTGVVLIGGPGPNVLTGGYGDDLLQGGGGADTLIGGGGADVADYSDHTGPVTLTLDGAANDGSPGEGDRIATDVEDLRGGSGDDTLTGDAGDNVLDGGPGADVLSGGAGYDAVDYSDRSAPVRVDLGGSPGDDGGSAEGDTVGADVEGAFGGAGDDTLIGSAASGFLDGGDGNDALVDRGGSDELDGGNGADVIDSTDDALDGISCGDGHDQVWRDRIDLVDDDCEAVAIGPAPPAPDTPRPTVVVHLPAAVVGRPALTPARTTTPARTPGVDTDAPLAGVFVARGARLSGLLVRGLSVDVRCSERCRVSGRLVARRGSATAKALRRHGLAAGATLARGTTGLGGHLIRLRVTAAGRRGLKGLRSASLELVVTVSDRAGNRRESRQTLTLRH